MIRSHVSHLRFRRRIGLLAAGVRGAFRACWWQGYQAGQAAGPEEGAMPSWGPRARISPSLAILTSTFGMGSPTNPQRGRSIRCTAIMPVDSV